MDKNMRMRILYPTPQDGAKTTSEEKMIEKTTKCVVTEAPAHWRELIGQTVMSTEKVGAVDPECQMFDLQASGAALYMNGSSPIKAKPIGA